MAKWQKLLQMIESIGLFLICQTIMCVILVFFFACIWSLFVFVIEFVVFNFPNAKNKAKLFIDGWWFRPSTKEPESCKHAFSPQDRNIWKKLKRRLFCCFFQREKVCVLYWYLKLIYMTNLFFLDILYINIYIYISMYTYHIYVIRKFALPFSRLPPPCLFFWGKRTSPPIFLQELVINTELCDLAMLRRRKVWFQVGKSRIENNQPSRIDRYKSMFIINQIYKATIYGYVYIYIYIYQPCDGNLRDFSIPER